MSHGLQAERMAGGLGADPLGRSRVSLGSRPNEQCAEVRGSGRPCVYSERNFPGESQPRRILHRASPAYANRKGDPPPSISGGAPHIHRAETRFGFSIFFLIASSGMLLRPTFLNTPSNRRS